MSRFLTGLLASLVLLTGNAPAVAQSISGFGGGSSLATPVSTLNGGSGAALTPVIGDILAADSTTSFARITAPAVGQVLKSNGVGVAPSWSASPSLTSLTLGGATPSTNDLAVAGTGQIIGKVYVGSAAPTSSNYALWKDGSNRLWVNADATNSTVSVGVANDYGVTYTGPAYAGGRGWRLNSDVTFGWSATNPLAALDTGLSRISAGVIGVGTGAQGSVAGTIQAANFTVSGGGIQIAGNIVIPAAGVIAWNDTYLARAAAATLRHGDADAASPVAQTIKFQDVVAGTSNTAGVNATIQAPAGTGTGAGGSLIFQVAPAGSSGSAKNAWATALTIDSTKTATFASTVTAPYFVTGDYFRLPLNSKIKDSADGVILLSNNTVGDFNRLQFGGTTSSFPALKRSTTTLQARLADDSAFTNIQGKLTTDTAYVATPQVPTGYITIYDSTGTAYKVSVNP